MLFSGDEHRALDIKSIERMTVEVVGVHKSEFFRVTREEFDKCLWMKPRNTDEAYAQELIKSKLRLVEPDREMKKVLGTR